VSTSKTDNACCSDNIKHVSRRIAKYFATDDDPKKIFFGSVTAYHPERRWFSVLFDDGDYEQDTRAELDELLSLYEKEKANDRGPPVMKVSVLVSQFVVLTST
jgi:hypothetical protein